MVLYLFVMEVTAFDTSSIPQTYSPFLKIEISELFVSYLSHNTLIGVMMQPYVSDSCGNHHSRSLLAVVYTVAAVDHDTKIPVACWYTSMQFMQQMYVSDGYALCIRLRKICLIF